MMAFLAWIRTFTYVFVECVCGSHAMGKSPVQSKGNYFTHHALQGLEVGGHCHKPTNNAGSHCTVACVDVEKFPYPRRNSNPKPSSLFRVVKPP